MKKQLEEFLTMCYYRLERGEKDRKDRFMKLDLYQEIMDELADVANYAFLEYFKMKKLQQKSESLSKQ